MPTSIRWLKKLLIDKPYHAVVKISKRIMRDVPPECQPTELGDPAGAIRQYRCSKIHIREYPDRFEVHRDIVDPRKSLLGHVVYDAPEVLLALIVGGISAFTAYKSVCKRESASKALLKGTTAGILAGFVTYFIGGKLFKD